MPFVVDASVGLSWILRDEASSFSDLTLDMVRNGGAIVPSLWPLEVANGLWAAERSGRVDAGDLARAIELVESLPLELHDLDFDLAFGSVLRVARGQELTVYDAIYLDLAMREGLPLATYDKALKAAATKVGVDLI